VQVLFSFCVPPNDLCLAGRTVSAPENLTLLKQTSLRRAIKKHTCGLEKENTCAFSLRALSTKIKAGGTFFVSGRAGGLL
jgi:hypothetical protein